MAGSTRRSILLIESDASTKLALQQSLGTLGAVVHPFEKAREAMASLSDAPYGLIVLGVSGEDFADLAAVMRIRELPAGRGVPLIAIVPQSRSEQARMRGMLAPFAPLAHVARGRNLLGELLTAARKHAQLAAATATTTTPEAPTRVRLAEIRQTYGKLGSLNFYDRLGVTATDNAGAIRRAFMQRVQRYRPENVDADTDEGRRMLRGIHEAFGEAYATLRDPRRRARYEERLSRQLVGGFERPGASAPPEPARTGPSRPLGTPQKAPAKPPSSASSNRWRPPPELSSHTLAPPLDVAPPEVTKPAKVGGPKAPGGLRGSARALEQELAAVQASITPADEKGDDHWSRGGFNEVRTEDKLADAARLRSVMGDYAGAVDLMEKALLLTPDDSEMQIKVELYRGWRAKSEGKEALAKRHFQIALEKSDGKDKSAADELRALGVKVKAPGATSKKRGLGALFGFGRDK
ncbi:MAG: CheY-like chemotaxis protein [Myxococcota bacterium]|jgi:CheY-like chemotaxis protein